MAADELVDVIDENNNVIGTVPRSESYARRLSHRIVHVMVVDGGRVYLPRRALGVRYLPGYHCTSAGGHALAGETPEQAALRELEEEIGLSGPIERLSCFDFTHEFRVHVSLFLKRLGPNDRILNNPAEVLSGAFYTPLEIDQLDKTKFHPQLLPCLAVLLRQLEHKGSP